MNPLKKDDDDLMDEQFTELENCIWNSLLAKEHAHSPRQIHPLLSPPPEYPLKFSVENLVVEQVDTVCLKYKLGLYFTHLQLSRASMEFNVFGHILLVNLYLINNLIIFPSHGMIPDCSGKNLVKKIKF